MSILKELEKTAAKENYYDALNAMSMGNRASVLAAKAKPQHQDIVFNHANAEAKNHAAGYGALGLLGGGAAGAGLGALIGKISKKGAKKGASLGALLGLPTAVIGAEHGKEVGTNKAIKDLRKAKLA